MMHSQDVNGPLETHATDNVIAKSGNEIVFFPLRNIWALYIFQSHFR